MKSAIIAMVLAFGLGASATIKIEYGPNGSFKAISTPDAPAVGHKKLARSTGCSPCRDQCVRAVSSAAPEFCGSFLAATYTAPSDFAPVQTQCASDAGRVSAACSCFVKPVSRRRPSRAPRGSLTSTNIHRLRLHRRQPRCLRQPRRLPPRLRQPRPRPAAAPVRHAPSTTSLGPAATRTESPGVRAADQWGVIFLLETRRPGFASTSHYFPLHPSKQGDLTFNQGRLSLPQTDS